MISLEQFMNVVDYRISEGSTYDWHCYGNHAYTLSAWNGVHGAVGWLIGWSVGLLVGWSVGWLAHLSVGVPCPSSLLVGW